MYSPYGNWFKIRAIRVLKISAVVGMHMQSLFRHDLFVIERSDELSRYIWACARDLFYYIIFNTKKQDFWISTNGFGLLQTVLRLKITLYLIANGMNCRDIDRANSFKQIRMVQHYVYVHYVCFKINCLASLLSYIKHILNNVFFQWQINFLSIELGQWKKSMV